MDSRQCLLKGFLIAICVAFLSALRALRKTILIKLAVGYLPILAASLAFSLPSKNGSFNRLYKQ